MRDSEFLVVLFLSLLAVFAVGLSIALLAKGKLYTRMKPERRPRRWVLWGCLFVFAAFCVWFPFFLIWPESLFSRVLLLIFGLSFSSFLFTLKWFSGVVDWYFKRKGWPLR